MLRGIRGVGRCLVGVVRDAERAVDLAVDLVHVLLDRCFLGRVEELLEDDDDASRRLGATIQLTEDRFDTARSTFAEADSARLAFAQAMVGNFDWCLRFHPGDRYRCDDLHPLWNILGVAHDDTWALPVVYDFDLSGIVVGRHNWFGKVFSTSFVPSRSRIEIEVMALRRNRPS